MKKLNSYISSADMKEKGRAAYYKMLESVRQGELIQVRRGLYANIDQLSNSMIDIEAIIPGGILCLWSAWSIHQLTTSMPQAYHVAIKRDRKVVTPSFLYRASPLYCFYTRDWGKQDGFGGLQYQDL